MQWTPWAVQQLLLESVSWASHHLSLQPAMLRVAVACRWLLTNPRTALVGTESHQELGWESPETKALLLRKSSLDRSKLVIKTLRKKVECIFFLLQSSNGSLFILFFMNYYVFKLFGKLHALGQ